MQVVTDVTSELLDCERVSVRLLDESRTRLLVAARTGSATHSENDAEFLVGEGLIGWIVAHEEPIRIAEAEADARFVTRANQVSRVGAFLGVPLLDAEGAIGVLAASSPRRMFSIEEERWMRVLAGLATPYLDVARLNRIAITDELTLALNRRGLDVLFPPDPALAGDVSLSVVLFDIDHFKVINDRHGHAAGDLVLRAIPRVLSGMLRRGDELVRMGGDEMLLVLRDVSASTALQIGERACAAVAATDLLGASVTLSGGVAERRPGETRESLLERADRALYAAKRGGRNRAALADD